MARQMNTLNAKSVYFTCLVLLDFIFQYLEYLFCQGLLALRTREAISQFSHSI